MTEPKKTQLFKKEGFAILVSQELGEPYEHFLERGYFVVSQKPNNITELEEAIKYSKIYMNKKMDRCEYSTEVTKRLAEYENNFFTK
jgi:hypothetical protein